MNHYNNADLIVQDVLANAPPDGREASLVDAFRETLIAHVFELEERDEREEEATHEQERKDEEADEARDNAIEEAEARVTVAEARLEDQLHRVAELETEIAQLRTRLTANTFDVETLIRKHNNVVRITFGNNALTAEAAFKKADEIDSDPKAAIPLYRQAITLDPNHGEAWSNLGNCYFATGDRTKAFACWNKALEINPAIGVAHYNIGHGLIETGGPGDQIELHLTAAIDLDPSNSDAIYMLGAHYVRQGDARKGRIYLERFLALDPKSPYATDVRRMLAGKSPR